jgi:hypothetical protein
MIVVSGSVSGVRRVESERETMLQINANVNPGNSGGPVVDRDGYVVGVIQSKLLNANGVGFAVPINRVKDFLEARLLDPLLPSRRLRLGPRQTMEEKGVALRLPEGMSDASPFRTLVETQSNPSGIGFRIDRVSSPLSARDLMAQLIGGRAFEPLTFPAGAKVREDGPGLIGRATGRNDEKRDTGIHFAIFSFGQEAIVARYTGPADQIAFNARVLADSLASLEGRELITGDPPPLDRVMWAIPGSFPSAPPMPDGWVVEPRGPSCVVPSSVALGQASPLQDFSVALRAALLNGDAPAAQAALGCSGRRGSLGAASYAIGREWLGASYVIEGIFLAVGPGRIVQIEAVAPAEKSGYARSLLAKWAERLAPSGR